MGTETKAVEGELESALERMYVLMRKLCATHCENRPLIHMDGCRQMDSDISVLEKLPAEVKSLRAKLAEEVEKNSRLCDILQGIGSTP